MTLKLPDALVDTSVAVALLVADHESHESTKQAVGSRQLGLSGHAAFEAYSVLTRLPHPSRRAPDAVAELLRRRFTASCFLGADAMLALYRRLSTLGISGGSVYDALVGAAAQHHGLTLITRDARASETYRVVGTEYELLT